jgi:hypothetical protein
MPMPPLEWRKSSCCCHRGGAPSSRSQCCRRCHRGKVDAAGRDKQEVEGRGRLHALATMRVPPPGEGAPRSGPAPLRPCRRRRPSGSHRRRRLTGSRPCSVDHVPEDAFLRGEDQELAAPSTRTRSLLLAAMH